MKIYFGLGSNLGDRLRNLEDALEKLKSLGNVVKVSNVYETKPWGVEDQPDFLNACALVEAEKFIAPLEILHTVKNFEAEIGRVKSIRWGARKIDIDILLIDDIIYSSPELTVPHVSIPERLFVLVPLGEITPTGWRHPQTHKTINEMIEALATEPETSVKKFSGSDFALSAARE
ncbi:MAG: 2-amino-4-hydroxy-6-hydroxymethyldihydropteridine diphosphokinase [Synergistaceae bacterium]|nr:2-amino-4-hydroxy-6-hydroxymethyldihydropteridine diphosphokinase [Synergistaceae bacterium]